MMTEDEIEESNGIPPQVRTPKQTTLKQLPLQKPASQDIDTPSYDDTIPQKLITNSLDSKRSLMEASGITDKVKYDVLYAGLTAVKKKEDLDAQGNVIIVEEPDHIVRKGYLEMAFRVTEEIKAGGGGVAVNFNLTVEDRRKTEDRLERMMKKVVDV